MQGEFKDPSGAFAKEVSSGRLTSAPGSLNPHVSLIGKIPV